MKKTIFSGALIFFVVASLVILPGPAQAATNPATAPWFNNVVDNVTSNDVGAYPSIAYSPVDGLPYISYYDAVNHHLMLASPNSGTNCGVGGNWWCRVVDGNGVNGSSTADVGTFSSIAFWKSSNIIGSWKLGIAYHDITNNGLKYAVYSKTTLLPGTWSFSTIEASTLAFFNPGTYISLKITSNGTPVIAYYSYNTLLGGSGSLRVASKVTSGGNCGVGADSGKWQCNTVDTGTGAGVGKYASLDLRYDDAVYFAYYDVVNGNLKYAYYGGIGPCGDGYICSTVDSTGDVGLYASVSAPKSASDIPRIAYYNKTLGWLKYAEVSGSCGGAWCLNNIQSIGTGPGLTQVGISLTMDKGGYPIIAYMDAHEDLAPSILRIARPAPAVDKLIGNCGDVPPGFLFMYWQCDTVDNAGYGQGHVNLASFASVAVSPSGLATIAYLANDDTYGDSLRVAYQRTQVYLPLLMK